MAGFKYNNLGYLTHGRQAIVALEVGMQSSAFDGGFMQRVIYAKGMDPLYVAYPLREQRITQGQVMVVEVWREETIERWATVRMIGENE